MLGSSTATTWGLGEAPFLYGYGALCLAWALGVWHAWRRALGPRIGRSDPLPDLDPHEVAMLSGGPQLAVTTAAARLHRDGLLKVGPRAGTLETAGDPPPPADPVERAVLETVHATPGIGAEAMRARVARSEPMRALARRLADVGLLMDPARAARLHRLWVVGALLAGVGLALLATGSIGDGASPAWLLFMVCAVVYAMARLLRRGGMATNRGRQIIGRLREQIGAPRPNALTGDNTRAVALFGGGALWLAEPAIASTLAVPRESKAWGGERGKADGGGGCGGGGGGWDGGGGGCGGGGGGGGGGGCGGGGGGGG